MNSQLVKMKLESYLSQWFCEYVFNLFLGLHMVCFNFTILNLLTNCVTIQLNVFSALMIYWIFRDVWLLDCHKTTLQVHGDGHVSLEANTIAK